MRRLARFPTAGAFARLLVSMIQIEHPGRGLDLGAGTGALIHAALGRWPSLQVYAAELAALDCMALRALRNLTVFQGSGLSERLDIQLGVAPSSIDVAVCNPPYLSRARTPRVARLLGDAGLTLQRPLQRIGADLLFLAQNLRLLREGGELGIILPDSLVAGQAFTELRDALLTTHGVLAVIQLPHLAFNGAEAQTHAVLVRKGGVTPAMVPLFQADYAGNRARQVLVSRDGLVHRMDHAFHAWREVSPLPVGIRLGDLPVEIRRGSLTLRDCRLRGFRCFHTGDFVADGRLVLGADATADGLVTAEPGDILLARVGTRCIGRVGLVVSGRAILTDCVYRLRPPAGLADRLCQALQSESGQAWMQANAHGVGARFLGKEDLLGFRLPKAASIPAGASFRP